MTIAVQPARPEDGDALRRIYRDTRRAHFHWLDPDSLRLEDFDKASEGELVLTARVEDTIAGFVSLWEPDRFVHSLFVLPDYQHLGVGKALLAASEQALGLPLTLKCMQANDKALAFYRSQGWVVVQQVDGEEPHYVLQYSGRPE